MDNNDKLKQNLIAMFEIFKNKPRLLAEYITEYEILTEKTKKFIINNNILSDFYITLEKDDELKTPFFKNLTQMDKFFSKIFKRKTKKQKNIIKATDLNSLKEELNQAIEKEEYEKAAKIKKFISEKYPQ